MTLNDPEPSKQRVYCFFKLSAAAHILRVNIVTKWMEIDLDNLRIKFFSIERTSLTV